MKARNYFKTQQQAAQFIHDISVLGYTAEEMWECFPRLASQALAILNKSKLIHRTSAKIHYYRVLWFYLTHLGPDTNRGMASQDWFFILDYKVSSNIH